MFPEREKNMKNKRFEALVGGFWQAESSFFSPISDFLCVCVCVILFITGLWLNVCIASVNHSKKISWSGGWMNLTLCFFPLFFVPSWKRGLETKVTYLALLLSLVQDETKKKKKRKKHRSRRRKGKKRGEALSSSSSSFLLARSVWPAFVRHSGVIYHVRDAWSSPCQGNTTQPRRHRSPSECVCVKVCECVCRACPIMECIIRLRCEANLSSPPLARLHMTPLLIPTFFILHLLFLPPLFDRGYMHVICVDRKLRRDLHIPPPPPAPPPPPPPPLMKRCLCQASPRVNLTLGGPSPPHRLSHLSFKSGLDLLLHTPFSLILCILSRQSFFFFFFFF